MNVGLVNYDRGNLRSVSKAIESCGGTVRMVANAEQFTEIDTLVLPGVGAFGDAVRSLQQRGLWQPIQAWLNQDRPFLGICLGYQLLFAGSEESPDTKGFGFLQGMVTKFIAEQDRKVPHMGWNSLTLDQHRNPVLDGIDNGAYFYFVHSYFPRPVDTSIVTCWCEYGEKFAAAITCGRITATQFHPEKSQHNGLLMLRNFLANAKS